MLFIFSDFMMHGGIFKNGILDKSLHYETWISSDLKVFSMNILGGIHIQKWDRLTIKIKSENNVTLFLMEDSTFAVFLTGIYIYIL